MSTSVSKSTETLGDILVHFNSRRLLLHTSIPQFPTTESPSSQETSHDSSKYYPGNNTFDTNVIMILSVLLCAIICSLVLNYIIRCALRCPSLISLQSNENNTVQSANNIVPSANTGVQKKALKRFPIVKYSPELKLPGLDTECVICLSEFSLGERVRLLPKCNHGFHIHCIDKWLSSHSSCPKCRQCLIETCQKIVGNSSEPPRPTVQETIVNIAPLEPEALICNYRN